VKNIGEVENMIKKILGILVCTLLIASVTGSSVLSIPINKEINNKNSKSDNGNIDSLIEKEGLDEILDELNDLINEYKDELNKAEEYCQNCIEKIRQNKKTPYDKYFKEKEFNEIFPENIQDKFFEIKNKINRWDEINSGTSGGKTDFETENIEWWIFVVGMIMKFWISHSDLLFLSIYNEIGFLIVGVILIFSGVGMPIGLILLLADVLIGFGFISLNELDQGKGIYGEIVDLIFFPHPILTYIGPQ
jgi:hypothetical protein